MSSTICHLCAPDVASWVTCVINNFGRSSPKPEESEDLPRHPVTSLPPSSTREKIMGFSLQMSPPPCLVSVTPDVLISSNYLTSQV
ncbi:hypothetical protein XELAEV_18000794mg [Xenopus laevis]|nr:hypothetical protein XELAEV_18000794mg [Xenopus laevis]